MALTQVSTGGVKDDAITKAKIPANQIEASELADNAVDTNAIANGAVSNAKIVDGAINNAKIVSDAAIAGSKLADNTITTAKVADNAITKAKINAPLNSRNMLINGAMQINQRSNGSLTINSSTGQFPCDRWTARGEGGSKAYTIQQISIASSGQGVRHAIKVTSSQAASVGNFDVFNVRQMIEGYNVQRINLGESGCKSMTLSFTVRSSVAGTHSGAIQNSAQNRSYPFTYTLSANTWTDISITIPPITSGSFNETNGVGLRIVFDMGCGNEFRGTAGQWNSAQDEGATGSVRILETNGATWEVTKVQLEVGSVATDFEYRSFGEELSLCQRYYEENNCTWAGFTAAAQGNGSLQVNYKVTKRATSTLTTKTAASSVQNLTSQNLQDATLDRFIVDTRINSSGYGRFYDLLAASDAEL